MAKKTVKKKSANTKGKKSHPRAPESERVLPKLTATIVCRAIAVDPTLGATSLYGVIDRLTQVHGEPISPLQVFVKLAGGKGEFNIGFQVVTPDGNVITLSHPKPVPVEFGEDGIVQGSVTFVHRFDKSGFYKFYTTVDDEPIGNPATIDVRVITNV